MELNQKTVVEYTKKPDPGEGKHFSLRKDGPRLLVITAAAFVMAFNTKSFVHTGGLYPGGATGLTLLIQRVGELFFNTEIPYTLINLLINAIPVYIGFRFIGKKLTFYSLYMIVLSSVLTDLIPAYPITSDTLLIAIFGGMINGCVISICLRNNGNTGGTDFIAMYVSEKKGIDGFDVSLGINACILVAAGILFGWDKAMYSIIYQFVSTQLVHLLYRRYQKETMFIVTDKPDDVCTAITEVGSHGSTVMQGEGAYEGKERYVVYSVISRSELKATMDAIRATDPHAFINTIHTDTLQGRFYNRPVE